MLTKYEIYCPMCGFCRMVSAPANEAPRLDSTCDRCLDHLAFPDDEDINSYHWSQDQQL